MPSKYPSQNFKPSVERLEDRSLMATLPVGYTDVPDTIDTTAADISHTLTTSGSTITAEGEGEQECPADLDPVLFAKMQTLSPEDIAEAKRIQHEYNFSSDGRYYYDDFKMHEKTIRSNTPLAWVGMLPTGELLDEDHGFVSLGKINAAFYPDPQLLFQILKYPEPRAAVVAPVVPALDPAAVDTVLAAPASQNTVAEVDPMLTEAQRLQREYDFSSDGRYYQDDFHMNEKTIRSNTLNAWVVIKPKGEMLNADNGFAPLGNLDQTFWEDPTKLFNCLKNLDTVFGSLGDEDALVSDPVLAQGESIEIVTPSFTVTAEGNKLALHYENAPSGLRWDITNPGSTNGTYIESMILEGSGTLLMGVPHDSNRTLTVIITNTLNDERLGPWVSFNAGSGTITQPPTATSFSLSTLAYERIVASTGVSPVAAADTEVALAPAAVDAPSVAEFDTAKSLQAQYQFHNPWGAWEDGQMPGAKWFESQATHRWYYVKEDGSVYFNHGDGNATFLGKVPKEFHADPTLFWSPDRQQELFDHLNAAIIPLHTAAVDVAHREQAPISVPEATGPSMTELYAGAATLQSQYQLHNPWNAWEDGQVPGAKWYEGGDKKWYFIKDDGNGRTATLYKNNGAGLSTATELGQVPVSFMEYPWLFWTPPEQVLGKSVTELQAQEDGERIAATDAVLSEDAPLDPAAIDALLADPAALEEQSIPAQAASASIEAEVSYDNPFTLQQAYRFHNRENDYKGNSDGVWFMDKNNWWYVARSDGRVIQWRYQEEVARLDPRITASDQTIRQFLFAAEEEQVLPERIIHYEQSALSLRPELDGNFRARSAQIVLPRLPAVPDVRSLVRAKRPDLFAATSDGDDAITHARATEFAEKATSGSYPYNYDQMVRGMEEERGRYMSEVSEASHYRGKIIEAKTAEAFRQALRQKVQGERIDMQAIEDAGLHAVRPGDRLTAYAYFAADIPSASQLLSVIQERAVFDQLYRVLTGLEEREQYLVQQTNERANAVEPKVEPTDAERTANLWRVNRRAFAAILGEEAYELRLAALEGRVVVERANPAYVVTGNTTVDTAEWTTLITEDLEIQSGLRTDAEMIRLSFHSKVQQRFKIDQVSMVSFWVDPKNINTLVPLDLSLSLEGANLAETYGSNRGAFSGESISLKLTPGEYVLSVQDHTNPAGFPLPPEQIQNMDIPEFPLGMNIQPYNTRKIEGQISTAERPMSMPVSMSVAEFDGTRRKDADEAKPLDPSKPVWVVVHGMNSGEGAGSLNEAAKALFAQEGIQIVTVDWSKAAKDITKTGLDVVWTDAVGQWAARQLVAAGFSPAQISGWAHSHGTYILHAMGKELMKLSDNAQMNVLIASDPAGNVPLWTGYDHSKINFADVSTRSIAFESSFIADSDFLAGTADIAFRIESPFTYDPRDEHVLGLTTLTAILKHEKQSPGSFSSFFSFEEITHLTQEDFDQYSRNSYRGEFEGVIDAGAIWNGEGDDAYLQGNPLQLRYRKPGVDTEQAVHFTTFG